MEISFLDNFNRLKKVYIQYMAPVCERWALTQNELAVVMFLHDHPEFDRAADIVRYCGMVKSHASMSVNHLEGLGYLEKREDASDHRTVHLRLTEAASPLTAEADGIHRIFLSRILNSISQEEQNILQSISLKIADNIANLE